MAHGHTKNKYTGPGFKTEFLIHAPTQGELIVFVTGNCKELGNWDPDHALELNKVLGGEVLIPYLVPLTGQAWSGSRIITTIPQEEVFFHYFLGVRHDTPERHDVYIRRLEGHDKPRPYKAMTGNAEVDQPDLFGVVDDEESHVPGYLNNHYCMQFTFDIAAVEWLGQNYHPRQFRIRFEHAEPVRYSLFKRPEYQVARYFKDGHFHKFVKQSKHGPLVESQPLLFKCDMHMREICHVRIDFYEIGRRTDPSISPIYFAYALVGGTLIKGSHGTVTVPVRMPARHQVMRITDCGQITLQYSIIKSLPKYDQFYKATVIRPWQLDFKHGAPMLHIGHRGCGSSYHPEGQPNPYICENTIAAFNKASEVGADYVEFDVMLDVDMTPIIYHDHTVLVRGNDNTLSEIAVKEMTVDILRGDRVYHLTETDGKHRFAKEGLCCPFPTLEEAFMVTDKYVGFNIELKIPMELVDGKSDLNPGASSSFREEYKELRFPFWNKNAFVDGILHIVMLHAGKRSVVFSSFDLDVCAMVRLKQVRYPVFLLICNDVPKAERYYDLRINYIKRAIFSAAAYELDGVVVETEVLFMPSWFAPLVKRLKLKVMCWGDRNDGVEAILDIKKTGICKGVIYNRIYEFIDKTKDNCKLRPKEPVCVIDRGYVLGYTGYVPGRLGLVGSESAASSNPYNCGKECKKPLKLLHDTKK